MVVTGGDCGDWSRDVCRMAELWRTLFQLSITSRPHTNRLVLTSGLCFPLETSISQDSDIRSKSDAKSEDQALLSGNKYQGTAEKPIVRVKHRKELL